MNVKTTALAMIALGLCFAVLAFLCFFAQKRILDYFLLGNIRQLDFIRSNPWLLAVLGGLVVAVGMWGSLKRGSYSGPVWIPYIAVLVGMLLMFGHKFAAHYQCDLYYRFYLQNNDGFVSWQPAALWYTYAAGVVLSLLSFVSVATGVYNLRH